MDLRKETRRMWDLYLFGSEEECAQLLDGATSDCVIIGTGKHEIYHNRDSFFQALASEVDERQNMQFQYKDFWCEQKEISDDVCLVYGELHIWWEKEDKSVYIDMDSRFSVLYKLVDGNWKVMHIHQSMPNIEQTDGEYYPKKLLNLYNQEKEKAEEMRTLAENDPLTGLLNFRTFQKAFNQVPKENMWLIAIDLDDFKKINDIYGHLEGNHVLKSVANTLTSSVRASDKVCRMGGDEFLILCKEVYSREAIESLLNRIKETLDQISESKDYNIKVSMGSAFINKGESFEIAFNHADQALYKAKKCGKNRWAILEQV